MRAVILATTALLVAGAAQAAGNPWAVGGGLTTAQQQALAAAGTAVQRGSSATPGDALTYNTVLLSGTSYTLPTALGMMVQQSGGTMTGQITMTKAMTGNATDQIAAIINENIAGSGTNGPGTSQQGFYIDVQKAGWYAKTAKPGQLEGLRIVARQGGGTSAGGTGGGSTTRADISSITSNVQCQDDSIGFCNNDENVVTLLHHASGASDSIIAGIDTQMGILDTGTGNGYGYVATCLYSSSYCTNGFLVQGSSWANLFQGLNSSGQSVASINGTGAAAFASVSTAGAMSSATLTTSGAATFNSLGVQKTSYLAGAVTAAGGLTSTAGQTSLGQTSAGSTTVHDLGVQTTTYMAGAATAAGGIVVPVGVKIGLDSNGTMWVQETSAGKVVIGTGSTNLFSVDGSGNMLAKGTITGSASP